MDFDQFSFVILRRPAGLVELPPDEERALQDAHLNFNAEMYESGNLVAVGPVVPGEGDPTAVGYGIWKLPPQEVRRIAVQDPKVAAGRLTADVSVWRMPAGMLAFIPAKVPHSVAEVLGE